MDNLAMDAQSDELDEDEQRGLHISTKKLPLTLSDSGDSPSSLFSIMDGEPSVTDDPPWTSQDHDDMTPALLNPPPIPGLFFTPSVRVPRELADQVVQFCLAHYFNQPRVNQIMLFGQACHSSLNGETTSLSGLPPILISLLSTMSSLLKPHLSSDVHSLLFPPIPTRARQAILNLYNPGEGITPHVDLLKRFGDGIVGVSLGSSCVMQFARVDEPLQEPLQLFLPERSLIVLSGDARYNWTHGIEKRTADVVVDLESRPGYRVVERGVRLSITFRWLLPGADIVGQEEEDVLVSE